MRIIYNIEIRILVKFIELKPKLIDIKVQTYVPYLFVSNDLIRINISYQLDHLKCQGKKYSSVV